MNQYKYTYGLESNHNRFKVINFNREIKDQHAIHIAKSIEGINLIGANPIIVNDDYIIDGQHRFEACKILGIPVPYISIEGMSESERYQAMHKLNSNAKNWGLTDYLKFYVKQQKEAYITLQDFATRYNLTVSLAIYMLNDFNDLYYKNASHASGFKYGLLKIVNQERAEKIAYTYIAIRDFVKAEHKHLHRHFKSISFIKAFLKLLSKQEDSIDFKKMHMAIMQDLSKKNSIFGKKESVEDYYNILVDIYNKYDSNANLLSYKDIEEDAE